MDRLVALYYRIGPFKVTHCVVYFVTSYDRLTISDKYLKYSVFSSFLFVANKGSSM